MPQRLRTNDFRKPGARRPARAWFKNLFLQEPYKCHMSIVKIFVQYNRLNGYIGVLSDILIIIEKILRFSKIWTFGNPFFYMKPYKYHLSIVATSDNSQLVKWQVLHPTLL